LPPQASLGAFPSTVWKNRRWKIHESTPQTRVKNTVKQNSKWESSRKSLKNRRLFPGIWQMSPVFVICHQFCSWNRPQHAGSEFSPVVLEVPFRSRAISKQVILCTGLNLLHGAKFQRFLSGKSIFQNSKFQIREFHAHWVEWGEVLER